MENRVGKLFERARKQRGLTPQRLASQIGYGNLNRGANRLLALERDGIATRDLVEKLVTALELDRGRVTELAEEDRRAHFQAWEEWADQPVEPQLVFRTSGPCIWFGKELPPGLTKEQAVEFTKGLQAQPEHRLFTYVLVWSRREEIWFHPGGHICETRRRPGEMAGPFNTLKGGRSPFMFRQEV